MSTPDLPPSDLEDHDECHVDDDPDPLSDLAPEDADPAKDLNVTVEDVNSDADDGPVPVAEIHLNDIDSDSPLEDGTLDEADLDDEEHPQLAGGSSLPSDPPSSPPTSVDASVKAHEEDGEEHYSPYNTEDPHDDDYPASSHPASEADGHLADSSYLRQPRWTSDNDHSSQWESEVPGALPDIRVSSPSHGHHHQNAKPITPAISYQRTPRGSNFSQKSLAPGRRRYRQQTVSRASSASYEPREARKAPLVLLHVSVLLLPGAEEDVLKKLTPTILERGVLIEHPRGDYQLLEELILEALDLDDDDAPENLKSEVESPGEELEENSWEQSMGIRPIPGRSSWDIRIFAANGLMTPGAWKRVWSDMERVDVEVARKGVRGVKPLGVKTEALMYLRGSSGGTKSNNTEATAAARNGVAAWGGGGHLRWIQVLVGLNVLLLLCGMGTVAYVAMPPRQEGMVFAPWPFGGRYADRSVDATTFSEIVAQPDRREVDVKEVTETDYASADKADTALEDISSTSLATTDDTVAGSETDSTSSAHETELSDYRIEPANDDHLQDVILVEMEAPLESPSMPVVPEERGKNIQQVEPITPVDVIISLPFVCAPEVELEAPAVAEEQDPDISEGGPVQSDPVEGDLAQSDIAEFGHARSDISKVPDDSLLFRTTPRSQPLAEETYQPEIEAREKEVEPVDRITDDAEEAEWWSTWSGVMQKVRYSRQELLGRHG